MSLVQDKIPAASSGFYAPVKRLIDIALVVLALPVVLPLVTLLATVILCDGGSPLYRQVRIGKNGRPFVLWKLRTMVRDAEKTLNAHLAANSNIASEWHTNQKLRNDPRVTRIGALIRRYSLDELPQIWNVLRGDMTLVGPRPMLPEQQSLYPGRLYSDLRPGLTGLWQVGTRNGSSFADRAIYDRQYAEVMSLATDLKILGLTLLVIVRGTGV